MIDSTATVHRHLKL